MTAHTRAVIDTAGLDALLGTLRNEGVEVVGPTVRDGVVVYDRVASTADLPRGLEDRQEPGHYRLEERGDGALFAHSLGPHAWKRYLHPPRLTLFRARRGPDGITFEPGEADPPPRAFLGVRSCELAAMAVQDRVFLKGAHADPTYAARRERSLVIAVNCTRAGGTCFCASMGTGPRATAGFDLVLTELLRPTHRFLVEVGTPRGAALFERTPHAPAADEDERAADEATSECARNMGRALDADGLKDLLYRCYESPRWTEVGARCLGCTSCTQVCPTCFCSTVEDATDPTGTEATRSRRWDSCFTLDFSYIHGGSVRISPGARYRQWMTHKLATWHDQFGVSGCVGCGRCITWCPVGIDITEEARGLREAEQGRR